jgi:hypothetical protein
LIDLNIPNNQIGDQGAQSIGNALDKNKVIISVT